MSDTLRGKWRQLTSKIRQQWSELTDTDVEEASGNWDELAGRLQRTYGYSKEKANDEINKFKSTLQ